MWSQYYQPNVSQLLRRSILSLCSENVPYDDKLEVDGIICISKGTEGDHIVVKLHEVLDSMGKDLWKCPNGQYQESQESEFQRPEGDHIKTEIDEEEIFTLVRDESPMDCRLPSVSQRTNIKNNSDLTKIGMKVQQQEEEMMEQSNHCTNPPAMQILPNLDILSNDSGEETLAMNNSSSEPTFSDNGQAADYVCRVCGSCFGNYSSLSAHAYDTHGRFTCRQCLNTFSMLCNLKRHERLHAGRKPYICATCGKGFSRNSDRRLHISKRHKNADQKDSGHTNKPVSPKDKATHLSDILTRLNEKNQISSQKNESRSHRRKQQEHSDTSVIDLSSDGEDSVGGDKTSDLENEIDQKATGDNPKIQADNPKIQANNPKIQIKIEREECAEDTVTNDTCMSLPMPLFTRSILRPGGSNLGSENQPRIIHIIPNNYTSGGHMEETSSENHNPYTPTFLPSSTLPSDKTSVNSIHGLSFGRIVFPGQPDTLTDPMNKPTSSSAPKHKDLPFHTYLGSSNNGEKLESTEESHGQSTYQPASPCYGNNSSRSSSPVTQDDHDTSPFISLDREYQCRMCKTQWNNFKTYEEHHIREHLRYPCQFCAQTFSNKNNRSRHIRSHTGQREHTCQECGKSFSRSDTLKEHQIIHTDGYLGDKCNYCNIVIKRKAELLGHIKKCSQRQKQRQSEATSRSASPELTHV